MEADVSGQGEDRCQRVLGDLGQAVVRDVGDDDAPGRGVGDVDVVETDPETGDDPAPRRRVEHGRGDPGPVGHDGVDAAGGLHQRRLVHGGRRSKLGSRGRELGPLDVEIRPGVVGDENSFRGHGLRAGYPVVAGSWQVDEATDAAPWLGPAQKPPRSLPTMRRSVHVVMRDGVRIAVDVHLPQSLEPGQRLPTVLRQTRYFRGVDVREPWARLPIEWLLDHAADTRKRFLAAGYAWVDVCARGSGASFGKWTSPWGPEEVLDGKEVVDWIIAQPWSDGVVGATGVSYDGTASDFLITNAHPAVKAIVPRFSLYDVYTDIAFPGGIQLAGFTEKWALFNSALDSNDLDEAFALMARLQVQALKSLVSPDQRPLLWRLLERFDSDRFQRRMRYVLRVIATGVRRVDDDHDGRLLEAALRDHVDNMDVHGDAAGVNYRDQADVSPFYPEADSDFFSPHAHAHKMAASGVPIYSMSGWLDAAYPHGAIKRFRNVETPGSRLILGPWEHGGTQNVSPFNRARAAAFDQDGDLIRFFDHHLKGRDNGVSDDPRVRYFTMGEEKWKSSSRWPPLGWRPQRWYFEEERGLGRVKARGEGVDEVRVDRSAGTGRRARWDSLLGLLPPCGYSQSPATRQDQLVYRSSPLTSALEVSGHPVVTLYVTFDTDDAHVFAYLEDELPSGEVLHVTEGMLRPRHRPSAATRVYETEGPYRTFTRADYKPLVPGEQMECAFDLLPTSWLFKRGHRLRVAITGADKDHFKVIEHECTFGIHVGGERSSMIELPVVPTR